MCLSVFYKEMANTRLYKMLHFFVTVMLSGECRALHSLFSWILINIGPHIRSNSIRL